MPFRRGTSPWSNFPCASNSLNISLTYDQLPVSVSVFLRLITFSSSLDLMSIPYKMYALHSINHAATPLLIPLLPNLLTC